MADGIPEFRSALDFTTVRDYAYQELHPLHYGAPIPPDPRDEQEDDGWEVHQKFDLAELEEEEEYYYDEDEIFCRAVALFAFEAENDNEIGLVEGQVIWVSCRHGQGWLLAENLETGQKGLVPEEYVQLLPDEDELGELDEHEELEAEAKAEAQAASPASPASPASAAPAIANLHI